MADSERLEGRTIAVTGVTGQVAESVATALAAENRVIGLARFSDAEARGRLDAAGVETVEIDLIAADFGAVPHGIDLLANFAVVKSGRWDVDLRANAEGIGLLINHVRPATVFHCSSTGVYDPSGSTVLDERAALGDNHRPIMPTYSICKVAAEEVVRTMCRAFAIPTVIARLNVPYGVGPDGTPRGWPAFHLAMIDAGLPIPVDADRPNLFNPIDLDDIVATFPGLVGAASVPATIVNWGGVQQVSLEEWCTEMARLTDQEVTFAETSDTIGGVTVDVSRMVELCGPTRVDWRDGISRVVAAQRAIATADVTPS